MKPNANQRNTLRAIFAHTGPARNVSLVPYVGDAIRLACVFQGKRGPVRVVWVIAPSGKLHSYHGAIYSRAAQAVVLAIAGQRHDIHA